MTPASADPMYVVASHEAGHAVACILAHRALGRDWRSFERVLIRRNFELPYIDRKNREIDCSGLCEGPAIYYPGIGLGTFNLEPEPRPGFKVEILATMQWSMVISLAGPFAEAAARDVRSKRSMRFTALLGCGGKEDYRAAEAVLPDYRKASKRRHGIRYFEDLARDLVLKQSHVIVALAKALLVNEVLDYDEAYAIVAPLLEPS